MTDELAPCPNPWCGSTEIARLSTFDEEHRVDGECRMCVQCGLTGPRGGTEAEARAAWNRRPGQFAGSANCSLANNDDLIGRPVQKRGGDYEFDGEIRAVIVKRSGAVRYAVEDDRGLLLVMNARQVGLPTPPEGGDDDRG